MFTALFWKATAERSVKTFGQSFAAVVTAAGTGLIDTDWVGVLSASGMAAVLSVATSLGSAKIGSPGPSVNDREVLPG